MNFIGMCHLLNDNHFQLQNIVSHLDIVMYIFDKILNPIRFNNNIAQSDFYIVNHYCFFVSILPCILYTTTLQVTHSQE